ncbi:hypothetical protein ABW21_db0202310 [Orbilia brochopaga]|nr:hypothetical protein ABW21_db0202310 [Drechslerella brochopaga]
MQLLQLYDYESAVHSIEGEDNLEQWSDIRFLNRAVLDQILYVRDMALETMGVDGTMGLGEPNPDKFVIEFIREGQSPSSPDSFRAVTLGTDEETSARADGYSPFVAKPQPFDYVKGQDTRICERPVGKLDKEAPHKDTIKFFPRANEAIQGLVADQSWRPGLPIVEERGWCLDADQAGACVPYYQPKSSADPKFLDDNAAAKCDIIPTSRDFLVEHPRGKLNGLGWGDFDPSTEWQFQGREVTIDMLQKKNFRTSCDKPLRFVSTDETKQPLIVNEQLGDPEKDDPDAPGDPGKTLFDLLLEKNDSRDNHGETYGSNSSQGWGQGQVQDGGTTERIAGW